MSSQGSTFFLSGNLFVVVEHKFSILRSGKALTVLGGRLVTRVMLLLVIPAGLLQVYCVFCMGGHIVLQYELDLMAVLLVWEDRRLCMQRRATCIWNWICRCSIMRRLRFHAGCVRGYG